MAILDKLTEGIVHRDLSKESSALLAKWEKTGLLEGIESDTGRNTMARLLENQAKELLRESTSMASGDVEGFAAVAFPIVRRVFGGLIANDLVSVQPMSLPSGLIFFLDFTVSGDSGFTNRLGYEAGDSLYGGGVVASQLTGGVSLTGESGEDSFYNLNQGYSSPTSSAVIAGAAAAAAGTPGIVASGTIGAAAGGGSHPLTQANQDILEKLVRFDADLIGEAVAVIEYTGSSQFDELNVANLITITPTASLATGRMVRRLTEISSGSVGSDPSNALFKIKTVWLQTDTTASMLDGFAGDIVHEVTGSPFSLSFAQADDWTTGGATGAVVGTTAWGLENEASIPEIDIKVDSVAVTAVTKKLKAKWSPELGQDLNAYHNLDAEVELTSILSEQIALEIDREILEDLIKQSTAGTFYWSRSPGLFVNRTTGAEVGATSAAPDFTGTVSEWYETLIETINDVSAQIHRKTLRGGANFVVCGPEVANILEFTSGFRASVTADANTGTVGAVKSGSLSKKFDVYVDPYFPRNVVLVGRKGGSFLESGYVYAPYVPLQVTPTIFGVEDFVPRKGVMTRYAKKMVRPDMYGLVIVRGLLGESGA
jgi:hypothetical protein